MSIGNEVQRCQAFINCHMQAGRAPVLADDGHARPTVTISRQAGCGALMVAQRLAELLQAKSPEDAPPWTVFDRNLMDKVLEDHDLPVRLAKFLPEDRMTELQDIMDELFGLRPAWLTVIQQTSETILRLAALGHVILIGRGSHVVTARLDNVFHVRLVAPLEKRIQHVCETCQMTQSKAKELVAREDLGRLRYLKKYFNKDIDDPLLYHLTINTDRMGYEEAAHAIERSMEVLK